MSVIYTYRSLYNLTTLIIIIIVPELIQCFPFKTTNHPIISINLKRYQFNEFDGTYNYIGTAFKTINFREIN